MAKVKSFIGTNQKDIMNKVKAELGLDAVIVSTRKIKKGGFLGLFATKLIEITAIADDPIPVNTQKEEEKVIYEKQNIQNYMKDTVKNDKLDRIEKQMTQLQDIISKVHKDVDSIKYNDLKGLQPVLQNIYEDLLCNDVENKNAVEIMNQAIELINSTNLRPDLAVKKVLQAYIGSPYKSNIKLGKKHIIIFLGPTGVGKTTSLAKIAASLKLENNYNIGLITQDTYRIGAVEQLKIYAEILDVPLRVIYSPEEIVQVVNDLQGIDIVLIDTAGRSPYDLAHVEEIKKIFSLCDIDEVYLFISATTGTVGASRILDHYSFLKDYKLVITKLDEIGKLGTVLNIKMMTDRPIAYLSNGQRVPEDIEVLNPDSIINQLLGSEKNDRSSSTTTRNH